MRHATEPGRWAAKGSKMPKTPIEPLVLKGLEYSAQGELQRPEVQRLFNFEKKARAIDLPIPDDPYAVLSKVVPNTKLTELQ